MDWIDRLDKKYGRFAIIDLMKYLIIGCGIFFIIATFELTSSLINWLVLIPDLVLKGQIWRLLTFIFVPVTMNPILLIFALYLLIMFGRALEEEWGSFRLNIYFLLGVIFAIVSAFITGFGTAQFINLSIFLAFAYLNPNFELLIFFVLPVKVKYIAYLNIIFIVYTIIFSPAFSDKIAAVLSLGNFIVFFGEEIYYSYIKSKILPMINSKLKNDKKTKGQKNIKVTKIPKKDISHKCQVCERTSTQHPTLNFGYCISCGSDYTYCQDHLINHEHIKN